MPSTFRTLSRLPSPTLLTLPAPTLRRCVAVVLATVALSVGAGCSRTRYAYAPVATTGAAIVGHPAAEYAIPPDDPRGRVRIATFGMARLIADGPRYFHVRMSARNDSSVPWVVDRGAQQLELETGGALGHKVRLRPSVGVDGSPERVEVLAGTTAAIDVFFELPEEAQEAAEVPATELFWSIDAGEGEAVAMTTSFLRSRAGGTSDDTARPRSTFPSDGMSPPRLPGTPDSRWPQPGRSSDTHGGGSRPLIP